MTQIYPLYRYLNYFKSDTGEISQIYVTKGHIATKKNRSSHSTITINPILYSWIIRGAGIFCLYTSQKMLQIMCQMLAGEGHPLPFIHAFSRGKKCFNR